MNKLFPGQILQMSDHPFDEFQKLIVKKHIQLNKIKMAEAFHIIRQKNRAFQRIISREWKKRLMDKYFDKLRCVCVLSFMEN